MIRKFYEAEGCGGGSCVFFDESNGAEVFSKNKQQGEQVLQILGLAMRTLSTKNLRVLAESLLERCEPDVRVLTQEEVIKYQLRESEKFALIDISKDSVFLGSDTLEFCQEALKRMTTAHPKYKDMQLVKQPEI